MASGDMMFISSSSCNLKSNKEPRSKSLPLVNTWGKTAGKKWTDILPCFSG